MQPFTCWRGVQQEALNVGDQERKSAQLGLTTPLPPTYPPRFSQPYSGFPADDDEG